MKPKKLKYYTKWLLTCFPTMKARCWMDGDFGIIAYKDCEMDTDNDDLNDFIDYFEFMGLVFIPNWDGSQIFRPKKIIFSKKGQKYHKNNVWKQENIFLKQRKH